MSVRWKVISCQKLDPPRYYYWDDKKEYPHTHEAKLSCGHVIERTYEPGREASCDECKKLLLEALAHRPTVLPDVIGLDRDQIPPHVLMNARIRFRAILEALKALPEKTWTLTRSSSLRIRIDEAYITAILLRKETQ